MGAYFLTLNRNKKSIAIDLKNDRGRALFHELVGVSDIVISTSLPAYRSGWVSTTHRFAPSIPASSPAP